MNKRQNVILGNLVFFGRKNPIIAMLYVLITQKLCPEKPQSHLLLASRARLLLVVATRGVIGTVASLTETLDQLNSEGIQPAPRLNDILSYRHSGLRLYKAESQHFYDAKKIRKNMRKKIMQNKVKNQK